MHSFSGRTRRALGAFLLAWLATGAAVAQDPNASAAQAAARDWLALVERGDAQASWSTAGQKFQAAMPVSRWAEGLKKMRAPLGAIKSRTIVKTSFQKSFPGVPDGDYALIIYTTSYANKADGRETLTLEREPDGRWRIVGYFIR
jgi:ketosteroid isomerase-like protein